MTRIYGVQIIDRKGRQSGNDFWKIGAWLRFVPEAFEPAVYEPRTLAAEATFTTCAGANDIVTFMHKHYPGVECMTRTFVLVDEAS